MHTLKGNFAADLEHWNELYRTPGTTFAENEVADGLGRKLRGTPEP